MTTSLGALGVFVDDAASGRFRDFLVSPLRRWQLVLGYLLSTVVIALIMTTLVLVVSLAYLFFVDGVAIGIPEIARTLGWITLACIAFAALWALIASFLRSTGAFAALSTIVGTVIGFLAGAFIAVGLFPEGVRNVVNALPFAQSAMLLRREFTAETLSTLVGGRAGGDRRAPRVLRRDRGHRRLGGERAIRARDARRVGDRLHGARSLADPGAHRVAAWGTRQVSASWDPSRRHADALRRVARIVLHRPARGPARHHGARY